MKSTLREPYKIFFGTLANQYRLDIIKSLSESEKTVTLLIKNLKFHQSTISHNLRRLQTCGFVSVRKNGKERIYSLNKKTIKPLLDLMHNHMNNYCKRIHGKNNTR